MDIIKRALGRDEIREIDRRAIEEYKIPGIILMENAGFQTFQIIRNYINERQLSGSVYIFCGKGNNGGDGFVIARHLYNKGVDVSVYLTTAVSRVLSDGDASTNLKILRNMNLINCCRFGF